MKEKEENLKTEFKEREPELKAWGNYVCNTVIQKLKETGLSTSEFLKVNPSIRIKGADSFIEKALHRKNKNYTNPIKEITDQVGVRFVVLIEDDIKIIKEIICNHEEFHVHTDRDYEKDRDENPTLFDYASIHLLVKPIQKLLIDGIEISTDTTCEVQIRTLLQHAYAELTHDLLYKPEFTKPEDNKIHRDVSKSMALLETTDHFFNQTKNLVSENNKFDETILNLCLKLNQEFELNCIENRKMSLTILSDIKPVIKKINYRNILDSSKIKSSDQKMLKSFFDKNKESIFLRQPIIILVLLIIKENQVIIKNNWTLNTDYLNAILIHRGLSSIT